MSGNLSRSVALFVSLLYLTLYLPLVYPIYFPGWYRLNCNWHDRCERLGYERADMGIRELNSFFRHGEGLASPLWSSKEKLHLAEVRGITDTLFFTAVAALLVIIICFRPEVIGRCAVINIAIAVSLAPILPFFTFFWRNIFHAVLFDNNLWLNTPHDLSYYIMPRLFFKHTAIYLIVCTIIINLAAALPLLCRKYGAGVFHHE